MRDRALQASETNAHLIVKQESSSESDITSGSESDGMSALRDVQAAEAADATKAKERSRNRANRGPRNKSIHHFHEPKAIMKEGTERWQFNCKYCDS